MFTVHCSLYSRVKKQSCAALIPSPMSGGDVQVVAVSPVVSVGFVNFRCAVQTLLVLSVLLLNLGGGGGVCVGGDSSNICLSAAGEHLLTQPGKTEEPRQPCPSTPHTCAPCAALSMPRQVPHRVAAVRGSGESGGG